MAKKKGALGKLIACTTAVAAIGGVCYIFRDKIMESQIFQSATDKANDLYDNVKSKINRNDEDDFFFDDDDDFFEDSTPSESAGEREYTSISISSQEDEDSDNILSGVSNDESSKDESNDTIDNSNTDESAVNIPNIPDVDTFKETPSNTTDDAATRFTSSDSFNSSSPDSEPEATWSSGNADDSIDTPDDESIPTINFGNTFEKTETVTGYENEGLSDVSEDPDTLEDMDKLDF